jgi:glutamate synthase (NADPH/NADH) small chain
VIQAMGAGRKAARGMKAYLGLRDTEVVYEPESTDPAGRLFGIPRAERCFARVHVA